MPLSKTRRKYADRTRWVRVVERKFTVKKLGTRAFTGYVTRLELLNVREPLCVTELGKRFTIADDGFTWLQHFPRGEAYCLTTQLNARGKVVHYYVDIANKTGVTDGIPWWDDLYLDIIIVPGRGAKIVDEDDLERALAKGIITKSHAKRARAEAKRLKALIDQDRFKLLHLSKKHFRTFDDL